MAAPKGEPGRAFAIETEAGFAIGLCTHVDATRGELVWMARGFWEHEPTDADVASVQEWRWCTFFPLAGALRRKLVVPLGIGDIPKGLRKFPDMRSGAVGEEWVLIRRGNFDGGPFRPTRNHDLPLAYITNDTRLKERLVSGWMPRDLW